MELLLTQAGLKVIHVNNDVSDAELNFDGAASPEVQFSWRARFERM